MRPAWVCVVGACGPGADAFLAVTSAWRVPMVLVDRDAAALRVVATELRHQRGCNVTEVVDGGLGMAAQEVLMDHAPMGGLCVLPPALFRVPREAARRTGLPVPLGRSACRTAGALVGASGGVVVQRTHREDLMKHGAWGAVRAVVDWQRQSRPGECLCVETTASGFLHARAEAARMLGEAMNGARAVASGPTAAVVCRSLSGWARWVAPGVEQATDGWMIGVPRSGPHHG